MTTTALTRTRKSAALLCQPVMRSVRCHNMKNPWLRIPASDYEAHMALPEVAQAQVLSNLMASALIEYTPMSLAVVGCSTGNGFEHINTARTRRVVGIDINPGYLKILETRFSGRIPRLELIHADITASDFYIDPVSMVFAGLVFEYVDVLCALRNIVRCLATGGIFLSILQEASTESAPVTATRYKSLERLSPIMNLVSPTEFSNMCGSIGLQEIRTDRIPLKKGKAFFVGFYRKDTEPDAPADGL
jgi:SAM-dependent methyltransferase